MSRCPYCLSDRAIFERVGDAWMPGPFWWCEYIDYYTDQDRAKQIYECPECDMPLPMPGDILENYALAILWPDRKPSEAWKETAIERVKRADVNAKFLALRRKGMS